MPIYTIETPDLFRRGAKLIWCLTPLLMLAACGPSKEKEPNDSYQQATVLKPGRAALGTLVSAQDQDWYRLDVVADGTLAVKLGGIRDVDFTLTFAAADRHELKKADDTTVGGDERLLDLGVTQGVYYVVVANKNDKASVTDQAYTLETTLEPAAGREREPNDGALSAQPLEAGGLAKGHYWPTRQLLSEDAEAAEEDWYSIGVQREGLFLLNAELSEVRGVDPVLEVYDTNGYKLKDLDGGGIGEGESLRSFGVRGPGKFMLRIRSKVRGAGSAEIPYDLLTELRPYQGLNEFEPNDQRPDATPLELESISGTIAPAGDQDWYKVTVATDARYLLRAELSGLAGMDLALSLKDGLGQEILAVDNMGREQPEVLTGFGVGKGEYYLAVSEKSGKKTDGRQTYTLSQRLIPRQDGLEWEPNASSGTAQSLRVGESVDGYFAPKGDEDWYEFNLYQKGAVALELTGVINVAPQLSLFDQEGQELGSAAAAKAGEPGSLERELEPGTYAVRLKPRDGEQNNVRDKYSFRARAK